MVKKLIIVESPTKARTLSKFLGREYSIKASMGHIRDLPKKEMGIDIENGFKPKYVTDRSKSKIIKELKQQASASDKIFLAPDHDREGEAIAWHLNNVLKDSVAGKDVYRIIFNEITKKAVLQSLENPGTIDMDKVDAQQARRLLDRLVGYTVSPLLWRVISKGLSAGRVQSVALRLICEREKAIEDFVEKEYWSIEGDFFRGKLSPFHAVLQKWKGKKIELAKGKEAEDIITAIKNNPFTISDKKVSERKVQPLPPFITSSLQQEAAKIYNFSPKRTMSIAQQLYEGVDIKGDSTALISYMRTDSLRISQEALDSTRELITSRFGKDKLNPTVRVYKNKNKAQDAHEAIRPTNMPLTPESIQEYLKPEQYKLYSLIWQRMVATQMNPARVESVTMEISAGDAIFKTTGGTIIDQGFLAVYKHLSLSLGENIHKDYAVNDTLEVKDLKGIQHFTKPPARYSEATLIKELESKGIGRPSTYSSITSTILDRQYVEIKTKKLFPTILGKTVNSFLVATFDSVFNVEFTKLLEEELDNIADGKIQWQKLLSSYYEKIENIVKNTDIKKAKASLVEKTEIKCDKCGSPMIVKWSSKGQFLACSAFPKCSNIKNFARSEDGQVKVAEPEVTGLKCPQDGGNLVVKQSRYGKFLGCSNYPNCKYTQKITLGIKCPDCKEGEIVENGSNKGKAFYSCSKYPDCKFRSYDKPLEIHCPECDSQYLVEVKSGDKITKRCPKCKLELS